MLVASARRAALPVRRDRRLDAVSALRPTGRPRWRRSSPLQYELVASCPAERRPKASMYSVYTSTTTMCARPDLADRIPGTVSARHLMIWL